MSGGLFRGTSADQNAVVSKKQRMLMEKMKFAPQLEQQIDTTEINVGVMKPWIARRVPELQGCEDELLINFIYALLDQKDKKLDGKAIQLQLTAFMDEKVASKFMKELWSLLLAQENSNKQKGTEAGIHKDLVEKRSEKSGMDPGLEELDDGDAGNSRSFGDPSYPALSNTNINAKEVNELKFKPRPRMKNWEYGGPRSQHSWSSLDRQKRPLLHSVSPVRPVSPGRHSPSTTVARRGHCKRSTLPIYPSLSYRPRSPPERRRPRSPSPQRYRSWSRSPGRHRAPKRQKRSGKRYPSPLQRRSISPNQSHSHSSFDIEKRTNGALYNNAIPVFHSAKGILGKLTDQLPELSEDVPADRRMKQQSERDKFNLKDGSNSDQRFSSPGKPWSPSLRRPHHPSPECSRAEKRKKRSPNSLETDPPNYHPMPQRRETMNEAVQKDRSAKTAACLVSKDAEHFDTVMQTWRELYKCRIACIERCEKGELDINKIREAYDALLVDFPFCWKHWIRYADHENILSKSDKVMEVLERAVTSVPESIDIWYKYCTFATAAYREQITIRRLFERAIKYVGNKFHFGKLWDLYIEYESSQMAWRNVDSIYTRILGNPIENIDSYFARFKCFVDSHPLHDLLATKEIAFYKSIGLALQSSQGQPAEADKLLYISFWRQRFEKFKENETLAIKKEATPKTPFQFQPPRHPWNSSKYMIALALPEFIKLNLHIKEVKFYTDNSVNTITTPVGIRMLKGMFRSAIQQYADGFCWGGLLKPEDVMVHFDASRESDLSVVITKPATVPITADYIKSDSSSFEKMLLTPFTSKAKTIPYLLAFFTQLKTPPIDVATNIQSRNLWLDIMRYQPLLCFLSTRLRLCRHLHKLLKHGSANDKSQFIAEFSTVQIPQKLATMVNQHPLLAEVYWYPKEQKKKKKNIKVVRNPATLVRDFLHYTVADIITFIRHFESHAMDNFKALGITTDNFEEIEHMIDYFFGFLLPLIVSGLHKIASSNPNKNV